MKITNKIKFIRTLSILIGLILVCIIFANKAYSTGEIKYETRRIYSGDTLWSISEQESINNKYFKDKDIRYIVNEIKKINNLTNCNITEGDIIKIPTYK